MGYFSFRNLRYLVLLAVFMTVVPWGIGILLSPVMWPEYFDDSSSNNLCDTDACTAIYYYMYLDWK